MGIAHALSKPTLLVVYSADGSVPDNIPFDTRVQRILPYLACDPLGRRA
jgi:hypothetical protein